ncbi:carboxypeptidase A1 [Culex quinquefasciatus]|uniref:Carboxypeptidase A1 n=1 Tax=Culex quinquefasciatus TaxID=7176 RepID=B0WJ40_CULQU|nr:carboxypeptidase A1 [Culex quinquefasciatus]|eukprot:XP_001848724.1 carboxypeptidase A1 [Culex quinquefasciatus]
MDESGYLPLVVLCVVLGKNSALNAVYVNNQKLDRIEVDKIKLLSPTDASVHEVTKSDLITKDNFTNPLQYYQYLVGNDPEGYVDLLWGKNKTYMPSIFRTTTTSTTPTENTINYADDMTPILNTLNNTTPMYKGDYYIPTTTVRPPTTEPPKAANKLLHRAKPKKKPFRPVVYIEHPVMATIGGVLESVYNYMQDAMVSTEYISIEDDDQNGKANTKKGKKIKRYSVADGTTPFPITSKQYQSDTKRVTIAGIPLGGVGDKNKLTTNIHVTSEYSPATPATIPLLPLQPNVDDKDGSSEESGSEEGGDYYGGFANTSYEDEEEEDSAEGEESDEYAGGSEEAVGNQAGVVVNDKDYDYEDEKNDVLANREPVKVKRQKQPGSFEEYSDEEGDDYDSAEDTGGGGGFFTGIFSSIGRFVRSLGFAPRTTVEYDDYDESRSTTPRILDLKKRPTRSTDPGEQTQLERVHESTEKQNPWYHYPPYMYNEINEEPEIQIPASEPNVPPQEEDNSDWFQYMMPWDFFNPWLPWDDAPHTQVPIQPVEMTSTAEPKPGWFPNLFGGATTEAPATNPTTPKPLIPFLPASDPLQKPSTWINVIAQHVFTTTRTPKTTTQIPSNTHITKPTKVSYSGYQLWRVYPKTPENVRYLEDYRFSPEGIKLQWWKGPSLKGANDILVPPHMLEPLADYLQDEDITKEVVIRNLGQAILYENPKMTRREQIEVEVLTGHPLTWYRYHRYGDIVKFMNYLGRKFPRNVELIHIGRSFEGRPLTVVKVAFEGKRSKEDKDNVKGKRKKKVTKRGQRSAIFVEAGAHGREWIGPSVATWILDTLTKMVASNDTELENMKAMDWYILPVLNPDGYEYSHEYDRMWRKTRSRHSEAHVPGILNSAWMSCTPLSWLQSHSSLSVNTDQHCIGTDLNRNWDYRWNEEGVSRSACSEHYAGYRAFSEPEAKALSKFLQNSRRNIQIFVSLHSYGQTISYPGEKRSQTNDEQFSNVHEMATVAVETLRGSGSLAAYRVDSQHEMSYVSSGTSTQYARFEAGIKYSYTAELPDTGTHGFLLPPSGIETAARDMLELIKGMVDYI